MKTVIFDDALSILWIEDGVAFHRYKPDSVVNIKEARQMVDTCMEIFSGPAVPMLVDHNDLNYISPEARKYFASDEVSKLVCARAFYVQNPIAKWVANVFLFIDGPTLQGKLFKDYEEALQWLEQFKNPE